MKHGVHTACRAIDPNAAFSLEGDTYAGLSWDSGNSTPKPTEADITAKIKELDDAEAKNLLRLERDGKLAETDWVVTKAAETGVAETTAWKTYRKALRDLPSTSTPKLTSEYTLDPTSFTWPTKPSQCDIIRKH